MLRAAREVCGRFPDGQVFVGRRPAHSLPYSRPFTLVFMLALTRPLTSDVLVSSDMPALRILRFVSGAPAAENPEDAHVRLRDPSGTRRVLDVVERVENQA
uniref:Uncharacterized protein n=1 Tax=Streptomyces sp. NBC_00003 TaxID=2903608 RepID=A0AAU2VEY5_9ACTN